MYVQTWCSSTLNGDNKLYKHLAIIVTGSDESKLFSRDEFSWVSRSATYGIKIVFLLLVSSAFLTFRDNWHYMNFVTCTWEKMHSCSLVITWLIVLSVSWMIIFYFPTLCSFSVLVELAHDFHSTYNGVTGCWCAGDDSWRLQGPESSGGEETDTEVVNQAGNVAFISVAPTLSRLSVSVQHIVVKRKTRPLIVYNLFCHFLLQRPHATDGPCSLIGTK